MTTLFRVPDCSISCGPASRPYFDDRAPSPPIAVINVTIMLTNTGTYFARDGTRAFGMFSRGERASGWHAAWTPPTYSQQTLTIAEVDALVVELLAASGLSDPWDHRGMLNADASEYVTIDFAPIGPAFSMFRIDALNMAWELRIKLSKFADPSYVAGSFVQTFPVAVGARGELIRYSTPAACVCP